MAIGEDEPDNKNQKSGKIRHLQKQAVSYWMGKNVWIHHMDQNIGNCLTKQKQYKTMSLLTSRALHLSAGIASHALLMIMFKDIPLLFG